MLDAILRGAMTGLCELAVIVLICMVLWQIINALMPKPRRTLSHPPSSTGTPRAYDPQADPQHHNLGGDE